MSQGLFRSVREYGGNETQDAEVDVDGSFQTFKQLGVDLIVFRSLLHTVLSRQGNAKTITRVSSVTRMLVDRLFGFNNIVFCLRILLIIL